LLRENFEATTYVHTGFVVFLTHVVIHSFLFGYLIARILDVSASRYTRPVAEVDTCVTEKSVLLQRRW